MTFIPIVSFAAMGDYDGNITGATWYWPFHGYSSTTSAYSKISSSYGYRGGSFNRMHYGVDIAMSSGSAIYPARSGTIYRADDNTNGAEGRCIIINHGDGYYSSYHHLSKVNVSVGQYVGTDYQIGAVGGSGYGSESYYGAHLHMQIHYGTSWDWNSNVNPCPSGYTRVGGAMQADAGGYPVGQATISYSINAVTEAPSNPILNISSTKIAVGEQITFNYSVNNAEHIYIPIDVNGVREHYIEVYGDSYSTSFSKPGTYCAALFARNAAGESGFSEWVTFEVYDKTPSNPKLSVSSNKVAVGESITFNYSVDNATSIYIPIDVDGVREHYIEVSGNSYTTSFSKPGIYCAALFARNALGESGFSEWVTFEVSADAPSNPKLAIYTNKVHAGQNILFEYSVENASNMYIAIDVDGIREHYIEVSGDHYNTSFTKPGIYHAALFARNANGESGFSNWVCFEVYNEGPTNCTIESNKSVYNVKEDVVLDFEANYGENYELKIYKDDIHILSYWAEDGKNNDFVVNFEHDGIYKLYVVAYNYYYHANSEPIYITVGKYSILYNSDSEENNPSYQTKIYNDNIKLSDLIPSKRGYKFKGWNTCADGSGVSYNPGELYTDNKNLVLYAQWEELPYTQSTVTKSGTKLIIDTKVNNITLPYDILIAAYKNNKIITLKQIPYDNQNSPYTLEEDIDKIKVMVWSGLSELMPLCEAEIIPSTEFITE